VQQLAELAELRQSESNWTCSGSSSANRSSVSSASSISNLCFNMARLSFIAVTFLCCAVPATAVRLLRIEAGRGLTASPQPDRTASRAWSGLLRVQKPASTLCLLDAMSPIVAGFPNIRLVPSAVCEIRHVRRGGSWGGEGRPALQRPVSILHVKSGSPDSPADVATQARAAAVRLPFRRGCLELVVQWQHGRREVSGHDDQAWPPRFGSDTTGSKPTYPRGLYEHAHYHETSQGIA
jgi:hypothetical protein